MNKLKVVKVGPNGIDFENGVILWSDHEIDCCEYHYLSFDDLTMADFKELEFDLTGNNFFKKIPNYGIELIPIHGHSVKIAGHGENNGCYSDQLELIITQNGKEIKRYDITECQDVIEN